jgi:hypothetical protein
MFIEFSIWGFLCHKEKQIAHLLGSEVQGISDHESAIFKDEVLLVTFQ